MPISTEAKKGRCLEEQECGRKAKTPRVLVERCNGEDQQRLSQNKRGSTFGVALTLEEHLEPESKRSHIEETLEVDVALRDLSGHTRAFSIARTSKVSLLKELLHDQEGLKPECLSLVQERRFVDDALVQDCTLLSKSESGEDCLELLLLILPEEDLYLSNEDGNVEMFRVIYGMITLRDGPGEDAQYTVIKVNEHEGEAEEVALLQVQGNWSRIRFKRRPGVGWLRSKYLVKDAHVAAGNVIVAKKRAVLWQSPASWATICRLPAGHRVHTTGPPEVVEGFVMVPVVSDGDSGAVQLKLFSSSEDYDDSDVLAPSEDSSVSSDSNEHEDPPAFQRFFDEFLADLGSSSDSDSFISDDKHRTSDRFQIQHR